VSTTDLDRSIAMSPTPDAVTESIVIERAPDDVFAVVADPANDARWAAAVVDARRTSPGPLAAGSRFEQTVRLVGRRLRLSGVVTELEPGRRIAIGPAEDYAGPLRFSAGTRTVEPVGGGARVTFRADGRSGLFGGRAEPLVRWAVRREFRRSLRDLKQVLEAGGAARRG
jgi:uncharacterized protein YndB with AHSA1/START domain